MPPPLVRLAAVSQATRTSDGPTATRMLLMIRACQVKNPVRIPRAPAAASASGASPNLGRVDPPRALLGGRSIDHAATERVAATEVPPPAVGRHGGDPHRNLDVTRARCGPHRARSPELHTDRRRVLEPVTKRVQALPARRAIRCPQPVGVFVPSLVDVPIVRADDVRSALWRITVCRRRGFGGRRGRSGARL